MLPLKLDLYFDGSCGPKNPGGTAGYAWRLIDPETKQVVAQDHGEVCSGPTATNNVGEWGAVRNGLRFLKDWQGELNIRGDSQLVIYQLLGRYKCRKDTLIPFYNECMEMLRAMEWDAHWIPREENDECDRLSKFAYAGPEDPDQAAKQLARQSRRRAAHDVRRVRETIDFGCETPEVSLD